MSIIVEIKGSKTIRVITKSKPVSKVRKSIKLTGQSSNNQETIKYRISIFEERLVYTTDGANKADKMRDKPPKPCWKSFDKRRKQWKPYKKKGVKIYPSVRLLNERNKCIFPETSC